MREVSTMSCQVIDFEKLERPIAPFSIAAASEEDVSSKLSTPRSGLVRSAKGEILSLVMRLVVCPSAELFRQERAKVFGQYSLLLKAISKMVLSETDALVHQQLVQATISNEEEAVKAQAAADLFSTEVRGEILLSIGTLRRAYRLIPQILAIEITEADQRFAEDNKLAKAFGTSALWCGLHIDCLMAAIHIGSVFSGEVLTELLGGLRYAVRAYAFAREGYRLRYPDAEPTGDHATWDEEDQALADMSADERESTIPDGY